MKFGKLASLVLCVAVLMLPSAILAQNPPPGAIFDLATSHPGTVSPAEIPFSTSFVADNTAEFVSFAFREVPNFWGFDDASVVLMGGSTNLLADPGFESATVGQNIPTGWNRWIQPVDVSFIGVIVSNASSGDCPSVVPTHGGNNFWCDGSVEGYDALYQHLTGLTVGDTYNINWFLGHQDGGAPSAPGIDMLVYAGDNLPTGTIPLGTPEPGTLSLIGAGVLAIGLIRCRRRA
jgi:hypothetical protein